MKRVLLCVLLVPVFLVAATQMAGAATEYPSGTHTRLLDHFNGSTSGARIEVDGILGFVRSVSGLRRAADYTSGAFTIHTVQGWYQWPWTYDASGKRGTIEMWLFPKRWGVDFLELQWFKTTDVPSSGTIGKLSLTADGKLWWGVWSAGDCPPAICPPTDHMTGNGAVPLNRWTHVAVTWSPVATKLWINGEVDAQAAYDLYPALNSTFYLYINPWNRGFPGYVDELRISDVARKQFRTLT